MKTILFAGLLTAGLVASFTGLADGAAAVSANSAPLSLQAENDALRAEINRLKAENAALEKSLAVARAELRQKSATTKLDFPYAIISVKFGKQVMQSTVLQPTGQCVSNGVVVSWTVMPSPEFGDEYVFVIKRQDAKGKTLSSVFKGGSLQVGQEGDIAIEIKEVAGSLASGFPG